MYESWEAEKEKQNSSTLVQKTMLAGMEKSREFHEKREVCIRKKYDADYLTQTIAKSILKKVFAYAIMPIGKKI